MMAGLDEVLNAIEDMWRSSSARPDLIQIPYRSWLRLGRSTMTRRGFRRWRARQRAAMRAAK